VVQCVHQGSDISHKHQVYLQVLHSTRLVCPCLVGLWQRDVTDGSLVPPVAFPQSAVSDAGDELEELLQMWHLAFQPSFLGACGFFLIHILILLNEGRTTYVENEHPLGAVCYCQETSFSPGTVCRHWRHGMMQNLSGQI